MSLFLLVLTLILPILQQDGAEASQVRLSLADQPPPPFPTFGGLERWYGIEGEAKFLLEFSSDGVVEHVRLKSMNLRTSRRIGDADLRKMILNEWEKTLRNWRLLTFLPLGEQELTVEYRLDPGLGESQRGFFVDFGPSGFPVLVRLAAPPLRFD